jgi:hypothetical protein
MKLLASLLLLALCTPLSVSACSPIPERTHDPELELEGREVLPTTAPSVRVASISRGRLAKRGESSCVETASITIAVRDDSPSLPFAYSFRLVDGALPDSIFPSGLFVGSSNGEGERLFVFYWPDLGESPRPFEAEIEVRAHSRRGTPGPASIVVLRNGI